MKRTIYACSVIAVLTAPAWAQPCRWPAPVASSPVVEIQGKIAAVTLSPGRGMPTIEVDTGGKTVTVWLGSMRYLMEQKFSPKAGESVEVRGYSLKNDQQEQEIVATSVKLPATGQVLKLRDEAGRPLWGRGSGWAGHHHCEHCGHP